MHGYLTQFLDGVNELGVHISAGFMMSTLAPRSVDWLGTFVGSFHGNNGA
ncbi:hypothetical protein BLL52_2791 [Rhodoferax antarcticus ANT.BR]|uniref:Uncharacterized protein n=1 Tax=Rhodoferax antarcticus ANT.BR TaxID=1111071 RepID=A0A1Q8YF00_9BURK|nr:hypothetical protein BLL52_2791 [Rhodoferax antarcticus ANT.BR]